MAINFLPVIVKPLETYLSKFLHNFSKRLRVTFVVYVSCLMLEYKRCSLEAISNKTKMTTYERLQYFLSDSKNWSSEVINTQRIEDLQRIPINRDKKGFLVISR